MTAIQRVLFIDDDPPVLTAFGRTLRSHHFEVDLADSAKKALSMAEKQEYAVIATDYRMPEVDGLELVGKMQQIQPDATYMLVSGECDLELAMEAVNGRSIGFVITKPWNPEEVGSMVHRGIEMYEERSLQHAVQENLVQTNRNIEEQKRRLATALDEVDQQTGEMLLNALVIGSSCETRAHCQRVASYAVILAKTLGVQESALSSIRLGALLHDLGKIGVSDAILDKPGPLTHEEMLEVQKHPRLGADMLEAYPRLQETMRIVLQHHERWDGAGYPAHLAGDRIDIAARILAVADAIDAMLSDRPHRKGLEVPTMVECLIKGAGEQFDPNVVAAFSKVPVSRWLEVRTEIPDAPPVVVPQTPAAA